MSESAAQQTRRHRTRNFGLGDAVGVATRLTRPRKYVSIGSGGSRTPAKCHRHFVAGKRRLTVQAEIGEEAVKNLPLAPP
jgi:hypothetical protein